MITPGTSTAPGLTRRLRGKGQPARQPLHSSDALRAGSHGVPNVRSSPRVHGSGHRRPPRRSPGRCGLHGGPSRATCRLRQVVAAVAAPPSCPAVRALAQGGDGCPAPLPRVAGRPFRTPFRDRRQEMCGQMRHTILADRRKAAKHAHHDNLRTRIFDLRLTLY